MRSRDPEAILAALRHNGWKDLAWVEEKLVAAREAAHGIAGADDAARLFPEFGLSLAALRVAWEFYTVHGMRSSELKPARSELTFILALLGLRKAFRHAQTLASPETWAFAMDDGSNVAEAMLRAGD
jgi:hypothetical protein